MKLTDQKLSGWPYGYEIALDGATDNWLNRTEADVDTLTPLSSLPSPCISESDPPPPKIRTSCIQPTMHRLRPLGTDWATAYLPQSKVIRLQMPQAPLARLRQAGSNEKGRPEWGGPLCFMLADRLQGKLPRMIPAVGAAVLTTFPCPLPKPRFP